jgi:hypothetical protein
VTDFVYPVNENDPEMWGEDVLVMDYFRRIKADATVEWYLGNSHRAMRAGDRIWVYATQPHSRVVAAGLAADDPQWSERIDWWCVPIRWDIPLTKKLVDDGPPRLLVRGPRSPQRMSNDDLDRLTAWLREAGAPAPQELPQEQLDRMTLVRQRQGQPEFRARLLEAYGGRCAVSECDVDAVLQAAHIERYNGRNSHVSNGLLLRADLHNLFDKGLLWVDDKYRVRVSPEMRSRHYTDLDGRDLRRPRSRADWPDREKLRAHREDARQ